MKTLKYLILSASILFAITSQAQKKAKEIPKVKIVMQFEDETDAKKYECNNVYYKSTRIQTDKEGSDYDMAISCFGLPDSKQLEWIADPKAHKTIKISILKREKAEREYILKNAYIKTFAESGYISYGPAENNTTYDFTIDAEQISINGVQMK